MALTKAQIGKAARLYGLAMAAHADSGGSETDDEMRVMWASQERCPACRRVPSSIKQLWSALPA